MLAEDFFEFTRDFLCATGIEFDPDPFAEHETTTESLDTIKYNTNQGEFIFARQSKNISVYYSLTIEDILDTAQGISPSVFYELLNLPNSRLKQFLDNFLALSELDSVDLRDRFADTRRNGNAHIDLIINVNQRRESFCTIGSENYIPIARLIGELYNHVKLYQSQSS